VTGHRAGALCAALALVGVGCAAGTSAPPGGTPSTPHWDRPAPQLRTLTLDPHVAAFVRTVDGRDLSVAIGGIFARDEGRAPLPDALALIVVVEGPGSAGIDGEGATLRLQYDGQLFVGGPGERPVGHIGDARTVFTVEVPRTVVEGLVSATTVRGRIGSEVAFVLTGATRGLFAEFLAELPADALGPTHAPRH